MTERDGPVMAITKCRIWARAVSRFTVVPRALRQCGCSDWMGPFAGLMEKIMSMTPMHNSEAMSNHVRELTNQANELTTDELEHVSSGGLFNYGHIEWTYYPQKADGTARV
jgi:hypothetical protein